MTERSPAWRELRSLTDRLNREEDEALETDGSLDAALAVDPEARAIRNDENVGFARANGQAEAIARGRTLFFVNNDIELEPDALPTLVRCLEEHPDAVAAGPRLAWPDGG